MTPPIHTLLGNPPTPHRLPMLQLRTNPLAASYAYAAYPHAYYLLLLNDSISYD